MEVDGRATNHDKFQHDVYFTAALWDARGVRRAEGFAYGCRTMCGADLARKYHESQCVLAGTRFQGLNS